MIFLYICAAPTVLLLFAIFGVLTNILVAIHNLTRATRETPILTRPSSFRRES